MGQSPGGGTADKKSLRERHEPKALEAWEYALRTAFQADYSGEVTVKLVMKQGGLLAVNVTTNKSFG